MSPKITFLASALALSTALATHAHADVIYRVFNPANNNFTLFIYDSPTFITTDTTVGVAQLAFANPLNTITSVEFIPSSLTNPGTSELDVFQSLPGTEQVRFYPLGTFTQFGITLGEMGSFGFPNSRLSVAVPEPGTLGLLGVGILGLLGLRRATRGESSSGSWTGRLSGQEAFDMTPTR
jgi:hypothetical protein